MTIVTAEDAQSRLSELVDLAAGGELVVITRAGRPVATIRDLPDGVAIPGRAKGMLVIHEDDVPGTTTVRKPRVPGSAKGLLVIDSEDDDHLADFAEYTG